MTALPNELSQCPNGSAGLLQDALAALHLTGALFLRAEFSSPWALQSSDGEQLARALEPRARRVILFHVVLEGQLVVSQGGADEKLGPGDVAILPHADRHILRSPEEAHAVPIGALLPPRPWARMPFLRHGGGGAITSIACGYLYSDDLHLSPVLGAMPMLIVVRPRAGGFREWLTTNVRFALAETETREDRHPLLMQRLPELLLLECLDEYARAQVADSAGWLAAAADPIVGRALALMHHSPERAWSLKTLPRACSTSRSVLDERFRRLLGCPPMQYLTSFRLQLAARRLRTSADTVADIASTVGYGTVPSFSRAFKRYTGRSPREWRRGNAGSKLRAKSR